MKKQTAVSIIIENFNLLSDYDFKIWFLNSIDKLEALEKEQMKNAVLDEVWDNENMKKKFADRFEQYYNETYEK